MYTPKHFQESETAILYELIRQNPLGTLIIQTPSGLEANHIPFYLAISEQQVSLWAHVARANLLWREPAAESTSLIVFQGPSAYVSPSWYPAKQEHGKVVPTWNYAAVHVYGHLVVHDDADWIRNQIELLTGQMESDQTQPWSVSDAPEDYIHNMMQAIVGIELKVTQLEGKWKLSQNKNQADQHGIIAGLEARQEHESQSMAELMKKRIVVD